MMPRAPYPDPVKVETWLFDLDNTLYPASCALFDQVDARMGLFIQQQLGLSAPDARSLQKRYFREHGTTMRGLMHHHGVRPEEFLAFVHDIDLSPVAESPDLSTALSALPGRKVVFTNADRAHAERVLARLGLEGHFEAIFDIVAADYIPKPEEEPYDRLLDLHAIDPARTVFFEDSARNLKPAHARGMTTVWIEHAADWSKGEDPGLDYVHHRTDDLITWLRGILD